MSGHDNWDLHDYDDWDDWAPGAREAATDDAFNCFGAKTEVWSESEDEPRYAAAVLVAGAEPADTQRDEWQTWIQHAGDVLMQKYRRHWWFNPPVRLSPEYVRRAETCRSSVRTDELRKFYTWICKQRNEPWTDRIEPRE